MRAEFVRMVPVLLAAWSLAAGAARAADPVDFNRDVRPILAKNCFACHGPDAAKRAAGLRLDIREDATKELESGSTAIVPGDAENSDVLFRVTADDETLRMPPKKSGAPLSDREVAILRRWIDADAPYAAHWAFVKPEARPLPAVSDQTWVRNGIDAWALARLDREGLKPAPSADPFVLLRRLSLDLRGLPPTPEEIDALAQDPSDAAYERFVDKYLDDPAYGERWARVWLDLARYADSSGYGSDPLRPNMWRYRDWVIDAFNHNLPYDRFTVEQIAGDLLPSPSLEQRMATAFHRNTMTNTEGGTDDEEFRVAAIKDRVDTTAQVWMGLTVGCAKCHTHKYDPISNEEYYKFYAFFNQTADNDQPDERPFIPAPTPEIAAKLAEADAMLAALRKTLDTPTEALAEAQARWEAELSGPTPWTTLAASEAKSDAGATLEPQPDGSVKATGTAPERDIYTIVTDADLKRITALRLETLPDPAFPAGGAGRAPDGNFVLSRIAVEARPASDDPGAATPVGRTVRIELPGGGQMLSLAEVQVFRAGRNVAPKGEAKQSSTDYDGPARLAIDGDTNGHYHEAKSTTHTKAEDSPWWEVTLAEAGPIERIVVWNRTDGGAGARLKGFKVRVLDDARKVVWTTEVAEPPDPSRELTPSGARTLPLVRAVADHEQKGFPVASTIAATADPAKGWAVAPEQGKAHAAVFLVGETDASPSGPSRLTVRLEHAYREGGHTLGRFRLSATDDPRMTRRAGLPAPVLAALDTPAGGRTPEQKAALASHYRTIAPALQPVRDEIAKREASRPKVPTLPVMVELPAGERRVTKLLNKGNFLDPGAAVESGVPAAFHALPTGAPADRLGLAQWLVDPENPLTARVAVNRVWGQLIGAGLVLTEEDFGTQGDPPTHPELLDWLAVQYRDGGWDTKALVRLIVTSNTYRQSSKATPELLARDPENKLLARAKRFRLEAETIRDQALSLSGLLVRKVGGPSVFPVQPDGLWQAAFNGERTWKTSDGADRYRRGLYTFWRRTVPYPSMATFDAPSRELCTVRRVRSNTPLQAFVTLNDPVYVEAAQALARRIVREGGSTPEDRVAFGLKLCLGRPAKPEQVDRMLALYRGELDHYRGDLPAARALATEPLGPLPDGWDAAELAAWTSVANVLLNLDGVLTRG
jgi:mono/diheme cytochrome c family protein